MKNYIPFLAFITLTISSLDASGLGQTTTSNMCEETPDLGVTRANHHRGILDPYHHDDGGGIYFGAAVVAGYMRVGNSVLAVDGTSPKRTKHITRAGYVDTNWTIGYGGNFAVGYTGNEPCGTGVHYEHLIYFNSGSAQATSSTSARSMIATRSVSLVDGDHSTVTSVSGRYRVNYFNEATLTINKECTANIEYFCDYPYRDRR